ncbi:MAG: ATP-binding protein [Planctomycetota bacterium]
MSPAIKRLILVVFLGLELALVLVATTDQFSSVAVSNMQLYVSMGALAVAYVGYLKLAASSAQRNQLREKERTGRLLETVPLPALLLGADGRINLFNQRAQRVLGLGLQHVGTEASSHFEAPSPHPLKGGFSGTGKALCRLTGKEVELTVEFRGDSSGADSIVLARPIDQPNPSGDAKAPTIKNTCDPRSVMDSVALTFKPWLAARRVTLALEGPAGLSLPLSSNDLGDVVRRLLIRSLASVSDGSEIRLEVSGDGGISLSITDRGAGLDPAHAEEGPGGRTLAIVRSCVESSGGTFTVEGAPGKGSRVSLRF